MATSIQHVSWILLRAIGASQSQLTHLLGSTGMALPGTEQQFYDMCAYIRRMGHVLENHPSSFNQLGTRTQRTFLGMPDPIAENTFASLGGEAPVIPP